MRAEAPSALAASEVESRTSGLGSAAGRLEVDLGDEGAEEEVTAVVAVAGESDAEGWGAGEGAGIQLIYNT